MQGFQLHTVKYIFLGIELRYRFEILYGVFQYIGLLSPKISRGSIKK